MFFGNVKKLALGTVIAGVAWSMTAPQADAFWHHRRYGSSGGSWGSSGGSSSSSSGGWYSSGGSSSSSGCWGGYYYGGGSWGSSGGSSSSSSGGYSSGGSWGSSGGSSSSGGSYGGGYTTVRDVPAGGVVAPAAPGAPTEPPALDPNAPAPGVDAPQTSIGNGSAAVLSVHVPTDAKVYVNGMLTRSTGSDRRYVSNGLRPGFNYTYEVRAITERNGQPVEERKVVQLQAGQSADVNLPLQGQENADERTATKPVIKTTLKLNVPADAKVFLSGNESKSTGASREFVTTKLGEGQSWDNYTVRVELEHNGQKISKVERITLNAGESRELTIDVDAAQVAKASTGVEIQ